ncbi:MAG: hypothetical protein ABI182_07820 [Candidatus Baltobacteraceae bacterium]
MSWIGLAIALAVIFNVVRSIKSAPSRWSAADPTPASRNAAARSAGRLPSPVPTRAAGPSPRPASASIEEDALPGSLLSIPMRPTGALHGFFEDGKSVRRAVIAAEIFGPPVALKERTPWQI